MKALFHKLIRTTLVIVCIFTASVIYGQDPLYKSGNTYLDALRKEAYNKSLNSSSPSSSSSSSSGSNYVKPMSTAEYLEYRERVKNGGRTNAEIARDREAYENSPEYKERKAQEEKERAEINAYWNKKEASFWDSRNARIEFYNNLETRDEISIALLHTGFPEKEVVNFGKVWSSGYTNDLYQKHLKPLKEYKEKENSAGFEELLGLIQQFGTKGYEALLALEHLEKRFPEKRSVIAPAKPFLTASFWRQTM